MTAVFVTGIGTEIGKTVVSAVLSLSSRAAYWKPVQTGPATEVDTYVIRDLLGKDLDIWDAVYSFNEPISPHAAAMNAGTEIDINTVVKTRKKGKVIIEGVAGLLPPITLKQTGVDMMSAFNVPLVLVVRHYLGSINHTLLTLEAIKRRGLTLLGIVWNGEENPVSEEAILSLAPWVKVVGRVPQLNEVSRESLLRAAEDFREQFGDIVPEVKEKGSSDLLERDKKVIWHPYTQHLTEPSPIAIVKGEGAYLIDENGKRYIDSNSSWWVNLHGHAHPYIQEKLSEQLSKVHQCIFATCTHEPAVELAERLLSKMPSKYSRVFYSDNGATCVETGLKIAMQYHHNQGRTPRTVIALQGGFHGETIGSLSVGDRSPISAPFEKFLFDVKHLPQPFDDDCVETLKALDEIIDNNEIAAFIYEPCLQLVGGVNILSPVGLSKVLKRCKERGIITIADEVATGFYRTGKYFASEYIQEKPDIMCVSKTLTGGTLPLAATIVTEETFEAFLHQERKKALIHGHSYTGNSLSCVAALANMDLLEREDTKQSIARIGSLHRDFVERVSGHERIANARSLGTICAIDVVTTGKTEFFNPIRDQLYRFFLDRGIVMRPLGNTLLLSPPYCTDNETLNVLYGAMVAAAESVG